MHSKHLFLTFSFRENFQLIRPVRLRRRVLLCVSALLAPFHLLLCFEGCHICQKLSAMTKL